MGNVPLWGMVHHGSTTPYSLISPDVKLVLNAFSRYLNIDFHPFLGGNIDFFGHASITETKYAKFGGRGPVMETAHQCDISFGQKSVNPPKERRTLLWYGD